MHWYVLFAECATAVTITTTGEYITYRERIHILNILQQYIYVTRICKQYVIIQCGIVLAFYNIHLIKYYYGENISICQAEICLLSRMDSVSVVCFAGKYPIGELIRVK